MKKILIFLFLSIGLLTDGQITVTYDFLKDSIYGIKNPGYGKTVRLRVVNVNTFMYKTIISGKEIDYNTDGKQFYKLLEIAMPVQNNSVNSVEDKSGSKNAKENPFISAIENYKNAVSELENAKVLFNDLSDILYMSGQPFSVIDEGKRNIVNEFLDTEAENSAEIMVQIRRTIIKRGEFVKDSFTKVETEFNKLINPDKVFINLKTEADTLNKAVNKIDLSKLADDIINLYQKFNEINFTSYSTPIVAKTDEIIFKVEIFPLKKSDKILTRDTVRFEIPLNVTNGLKIDFSSGVIFNFSNCSFDQTYRLEENTVDSSLLTVRQNSNRNMFMPSFGAFMHFYPRQTSVFKFGGTFGLSTMDLKDLRYHLGVSCIMGSKNRVILSCGATGNYAQNLSSEYKVDQDIRKDSGLKEVPVTDVFRIGAFISFSYNLNTAK